MNEIECAFSGMVGRAPELRTSKAGKPWTFFPVAVGDGEAKQWVKVSVFRETAEALCRTLEKGSRVYVEGRLSASLWQPETGPARVNLDVAAWKAEKLGQIGRNRPPKPRDQGDGSGRHSGQERHFDDELPAEMR